MTIAWGLLEENKLQQQQTTCKCCSLQYLQGRARFQLEQEDAENVQRYTNWVFTDNALWIPENLVVES